MQQDTNNKKRSLNDPKAKVILNRVRAFQRKCEDAWTEVRINELRLRDYLSNIERSDLDYLNMIRDDVDLIEMVSDDKLTNEIEKRIDRKRFKLIVRGYVNRDLTIDKEGVQFVEVELNGNKDERIDIQTEN